MAAETIPAPHEDAPAFAVRDEIAGDRNFVLTTWRRAESASRSSIERRRFLPWQDRMMAGVLERPNVRVLVASPVDDDTIAGYAVVNLAPHENGIHLVYVAPDMRRIGIARLLLSRFDPRETVYYCARPARVIGANGWENQTWFASKIPPAWRYLERMAYFPLET